MRQKEFWVPVLLTKVGRDGYYLNVVKTDTVTINSYRFKNFVCLFTSLE